MERIAQEIASQVIRRMKSVSSNLASQDAELRSIFHGPPEEILNQVFQILTAEGGIDASYADGTSFNFPVLLQVDSLRPEENNPPLGTSGRCTRDYLMVLRNNCPRFLVLVPPGHHSILSVASASDEFGLSPDSNSATANINNWWHDNFIQSLVDDALARHEWLPGDKDEARTLLFHAVQAADEVDRHQVARESSWRVLSRLWAISATPLPFGSMVSLASGFPPVASGSVDAHEQLAILHELSDRLEDAGFRRGIERIKEGADEEETLALEQVLKHLDEGCDVPTAFGASAPFFYGPLRGFEMDAPPQWWIFLTAERWRKLLDDGSQPKGAIKIECTNPMVPVVRGMVPVVLSEVKLRIMLPSAAPGIMPVTLTRGNANAAGGKQWDLDISGNALVEDTSIPTHKAPVRYTAAGGVHEIKDGSIRVVSLATWDIGFVAYSRTASKVAMPKALKTNKEKVAVEASISLHGEGRHYIDVYVRPGVTLGDAAHGSDESGEPSPDKVSSIAQISEVAYGFEVDATGECSYQFNLVRDPQKGPELARVHFTCDEAQAEDCGSEFERLIRMNRHQNSGRGSTDVQVNRHFRCADLQTWMLSKEQAGQSYAPIVLATDYAADWRTRDWSSLEDTVFSKGNFLHDPRPPSATMVAPSGFIAARNALAERIRGEDENGLVETARLGEWLASDNAFAELLEDYVRSYLDWLDSTPESAAWCDLAIVTGFESDHTTLAQEPDAMLVSPLHPIRLAWHALAQKALFLAHRKSPCPAASVLDPDLIPDSLVLPLFTATGGIKRQVFFSVECSSDYWGILWNASRLSRLPELSTRPPFDRKFGILVGGVSSGFSVSQVHRALYDVSEMLSAKPVLNVMVSSAAGQNNACNEGLLSWCRENFSDSKDEQSTTLKLGQRLLQVLDDREAASRPEDAEISNLAEDTENSVRWYANADKGIRPDLGIIAQLETSNATAEKIKLGSPLSIGGLIRHRVREQLKAGAGAFLVETRMGTPRGPSGDGLADKTMAAISRIESLGETKHGYTFAPSINAIRAVLFDRKADYAAVSSSAVDPACFLGGWLPEAYLWDYDLPSYSHRAGDSNGYYLLSQVKPIDRETLGYMLSRLPGCDEMPTEAIEEMMLEVSRRGIPTVRGLSRGDSGASGDLGLFVAARLLQDEFRQSADSGSLFNVLSGDGTSNTLVLLVPVDPFRGYLDDLARATGKPSNQRPDLVVAAIHISDSNVRCRLTPIEVKFRADSSPMPLASRKDALQQAKSLSSLLVELRKRAEDPELLLWKLAFQHLLVSMLGFGFRVYSQQRVAANHAEEWSQFHARVAEATLSDVLDLEIDMSGRLIVIDGSVESSPRDSDEDGFHETIAISQKDAASIVRGEAKAIFAAVKSKLADWKLLPTGASIATPAVDIPGAGEIEAPKPESTPNAAPGQSEPSLPTEPTVAPTVSDSGLPGNASAPEAPADASQEIKGNEKDKATTGESATGVSILIGDTIDGFQTQTHHLNLSDTKLHQLNIGVVGNLGTGKTQLLKSLIYQISASADANRGIKPRFLIFDYKNDYSDDAFVKATGARVVKPYHLPLNLFDTTGLTGALNPWLDRFMFFSDVLDKIYSGVGPVQRNHLKGAVKRAYEDASAAGHQPTIYDVHFQYSQLMAGKFDAPLSIIDDLVDRELFSREPTTAEVFDNFLDGVVVVSLSALGQDDRAKNMLVVIMLNMFYEHMLKIKKRGYVGTDPQLRAIDSFLLVDEADNIMRYEFDVLRRILLQGREFGVGVILASQYLRHFKAGTTDYKEPLLTWFIHNVPNVTPQELTQLGIIGNTTPLAERIKSLGNHECLYKTHDVQGDVVRGMPFYKLLPSKPV